MQLINKVHVYDHVAFSILGNAIYIAAGRRTYASMSVLTALMLVATALFLVFYKSMGEGQATDHDKDSWTNTEGEGDEEEEEKEMHLVASGDTVLQLIPQLLDTTSLTVIMSSCRILIVNLLATIPT